MEKAAPAAKVRACKGLPKTKSKFSMGEKIPARMQMMKPKHEPGACARWVTNILFILFPLVSRHRAKDRSHNDQGEPGEERVPLRRPKLGGIFHQNGNGGAHDGDNAQDDAICQRKADLDNSKTKKD